MNEASDEGWSSRTLDRNIGTQYYYRLMQSPKKDAVIAEMKHKKCKEGDNPTIGILLRGETSEDIARYSVLHDNDRLFMSKYLTYLPTKEQLRTEIERQKEIFYMQHLAMLENKDEREE